MIILDNISNMRGEFTLIEEKNGEKNIIVEDHNLIVNNAKESMAEVLAGGSTAEEGGVSFKAPISRFELGTGANSGTSVSKTPTAGMNELYAKTARDGGDTTQEIYCIDFMPAGEGVVPNSKIYEYDSDVFWNDAGTGTYSGPANYANKIDTSSGPSTVSVSYVNTSGYIEGIEFTIVLPEVRGNQNGSPSAPIYYSEAGLFVRKGDLDTTSGEAALNTDMFAMKTFPPKPKDSNSKWTIRWKILW